MESLRRAKRQHGAEGFENVRLAFADSESIAAFHWFGVFLSAVRDLDAVRYATACARGETSAPPLASADTAALEAQPSALGRAPLTGSPPHAQPARAFVATRLASARAAAGPGPSAVVFQLPGGAEHARAAAVSAYDLGALSRLLGAQSRSVTGPA